MSTARLYEHAGQWVVTLIEGGKHVGVVFDEEVAAREFAKSGCPKSDGTKWLRWDFPIPPDLHLNGSAKRTLMDELQKALAKIREASEAIQEMTPNGRDYYTRGEEALKIATLQNEERWYKLDELRCELETVMLFVDQQ